MVLVDTSVWIRFLSGRAPYAAELDRLIDLDVVTGHDMVYGELLIGDMGGRRELLAAYEELDQARSVPHSELVDFVHARGLNGRGLGWIDIHILASALVGGLKVWTADERFAGVANELGVGYKIQTASA